MKIITYYDPETFTPTEIEFSEYHMSLANNLRTVVSSIPDATVTDMMCDKEGKQLMFGLIKNRHNGEEIAEKYKITIEKFSDAK